MPRWSHEVRLMSLPNGRMSLDDAQVNWPNWDARGYAGLGATETDMYMITRYDDLRDVLRDTGTFSSDVRSQGGLQGDAARIHT